MKNPSHCSSLARQTSVSLVCATGILLGLSACDNKTDAQKVTEAKQEAVQKINEAQAKADQTKLEATQKAQRDIAEAQRKAAENGTLPPAAVPAAPAPAPSTTSGTLDRVENKIKDALNVRPNEAAKDALENKAEAAKDAADDAAERADDAAARAAEATRKAGQ